MPAKKTVLTDAERRRRIIEAAKEAEADQSPQALDRALAKVIAAKPQAAKK